MSIKRLFTVLFFLSLFTMAVRETLDADMWWHLRTGQIIVAEGIPRQDIFSFTVPDHEWVTHEWLSEVLMWFGYDLAGLEGLMLIFSVLVTASFALVYFRTSGRPYLAAFVVLLAALASAPFWGVRPQVFNMLFTAVFVYILEGYREGSISRRTLLVVPLMTIIWANLHSGYLLGIALLGVYILGGLLQIRSGTGSDGALVWGDIRWLLLITIASFLCAAINPNGPELWIYPFFTLGSGAMQQYIQEWQSPDFHLTIFWPFAIMLGLGVISLLLGRKRLTWTDGLLFLGTGAAALVSARHIPLFAIVTSPVIGRYLLSAFEGSQVFSLLSGQTTTGMTGALKAVNWLIFFIALAAAGAWVYAQAGKNEEAIAGRFPTAAVDYLESSGISKTRGYNSYNWGGYLIWRGIPVFVDGRADVYGDDFLHYYRQTYDLTERWEEPLDDFDINYVLVETSNALTTLLEASDKWESIFADDVAAIYVRK